MTTSHRQSTRSMLGVPKRATHCAAGLTAETIPDGLEDAGDHVAFEMAATADFEASSAVGRELASLFCGCVTRHHNRKRPVRDPGATSLAVPRKAASPRLHLRRVDSCCCPSPL